MNSNFIHQIFFVFTFIFLFTSFQLNAQVDIIVNEAIKLHDEGKYTQAIELYKKALTLEPESELVHYEIALSYFTIKDYTNSLKHSQKVLDFNQEHLQPAYTIHGSSLDELGRHQESIDSFEEAIRKFGTKNLIPFNLAIVYYKTGKFKEAEVNLIHSLNYNPKHLTSNFLLGLMKYNQKQNAKSILSLYYFLGLEPNTERSKYAKEIIEKIANANISKDSNNTKNININIFKQSEKDGFEAFDFFISLHSATKMTNDEEKKDDEIEFIKNSKSYINILTTIKNSDNHQSYFWDFYIPFFNKLTESQHLDTYLHYINSANDKASLKWIEENEEKFEKFRKWFLLN